MVGIKGCPLSLEVGDNPHLQLHQVQIGCNTSALSSREIYLDMDSTVYQQQRCREAGVQMLLVNSSPLAMMMEGNPSF
jgi:hypothetical protein